MVSDNDQRVQVLSRALTEHMRGGIDNVSPAVEQALYACCNNNTPLSVLLQNTFASLGSVFLTGAGTLQREQPRLTESLLFSSANSSRSPSPKQRQRRRWIRAVLAVASVTGAGASPTVVATQDAGVGSSVISRDLVSPLALHVRLRPVSHPPYLSPQRPHEDVTEHLTALHQRASLDMIDLCHASIVAHETAFLHDLSTLLKRLRTFFALSKEVSARPPYVVGDATASTRLSLEVPLYVATIIAPDTAETRLAQLVVFTCGFMSVCATSQASHASLLLRHATYALQTLLWLAQEGDMTRSRLTALEVYVQTLCDADVLTEVGALQLHAQLMAVMTKHAARKTPTDFSPVPPSVLVHCARGVSRSPSIVILFFLRTLKPLLRQLWQEQQRNRVTGGENVTALSILTLLDALRSARPAVRPNLVFMAELCATWRREIENGA